MSKARKSKPASKRDVRVVNDARDDAILRELSAWFVGAARALPWRTDLGANPRPRDPWQCLVAEIMLQQTQVSRVIDFLARFLQRFPTPGSLAHAPESDVLAMWAGLGYYRRAKLLHATSKAIVTNHAGKVPLTLPELRALPGIGPYTAGSLASTVFHQPASVVDGNVTRVLARLENHRESTSAQSLTNWAWSRAEALVACAPDPLRLARFNEGLMELGATLCLPAPNTPKCDQCPLAEFCLSRKLGTQMQVPPPKPRAGISADGTRASLFLDTLIATHKDSVMLEQRPEKGRWASMWQPPTLESANPISKADLQTFAAIKSLELRSLSPVATFKHVLTHRDVHVRVFLAHAVPCTRKRGVASSRLVLLKDLSTFGISNLTRKALKLALESPLRPDQP